MSRQFDFDNNPRQLIPRTFNFNAGVPSAVADGAVTAALLAASGAAVVPSADGAEVLATPSTGESCNIQTADGNDSLPVTIDSAAYIPNFADGSATVALTIESTADTHNCATGSATVAAIAASQAAVYPQADGSASAAITTAANAAVYPNADGAATVAPSAASVAGNVPDADGAGILAPLASSLAAVIPAATSDNTVSATIASFASCPPSADGAATVAVVAESSGEASNAADGAVNTAPGAESLAAVYPVATAALSIAPSVASLAAVVLIADGSHVIAVSTGSSAAVYIPNNADGAAVVGVLVESLAAVVPSGYGRRRMVPAFNGLAAVYPAADGSALTAVSVASDAFSIPAATGAVSVACRVRSDAYFKAYRPRASIRTQSDAAGLRAGLRHEDKQAAGQALAGVAAESGAAGLCVDGLSVTPAAARLDGLGLRGDSAMLAGQAFGLATDSQTASDQSWQVSAAHESAAPRWLELSATAQSARPEAIGINAFLQSATLRGRVLANIAQQAAGLFVCLCTSSQMAGLPSIWPPDIVDPPRHPPTNPNPISLIIPIRSVYSMRHIIEVATVPGGIEVPVASVSLSYDADAYAWSFSAELADKAGLGSVQSVDNEPVRLSITIDGYEWVVLIEEIEQTCTFGNTTMTLKGRSLSALLGDPYELPMNYTAGGDATVQQLANQLLPISGWAIDWQAADWLVTGGAFSITNQTRLQALAAIANIGAVLKPDATQQAFTVQPRYPVLPWYFADVEPNLIVPEAALLSVSLKNSIQSFTNGVYVHGGDHGGKIAFCRLNGTAGDVLMPTVSNPLLTHVDGCRALGERLLASKATQPNISGFSLPLGGDFVLAEVGQLVEVSHANTTERAIINGVSIAASLGEVTQSVTVGESTGNLWRRFADLQPAPPLLVATLISTNGISSVLRLLDDGVITARGGGSVGQKYYVRDGLIEGEAPGFELFEVVV